MKQDEEVNKKAVKVWLATGIVRWLSSLLVPHERLAWTVGTWHELTSQ